MAAASLLKQPSPSLPKTSSYTMKPAHSDSITWRHELIGKTRLELEEAIRTLEEDDRINGRKPKKQQALYNSLIHSCVFHKALNEGIRLREHLDRISFKPSLFLNNQFINLYSKCGEPGKAHKMFDEMPERNLVSWNAMIAGFCHNSQFLDALALLQAMVEEGVVPDHLTYLSALRASVGSMNLEHGEQIHARIIKDGVFSSIIEVGNALINLYFKFGWLGEAESVFVQMLMRDEVTWNSLIAGNLQNGNSQRALALFVEMQEEGEAPDEFTYGSLLAMKDPDFVQKFHSQIIKKGLGSNVIASSALLDAYGRCGRPREAIKVFNSMTKKNIISWNSAIAACVDNDEVTEGVHLFLQMQKIDLIPDDFSISILLKAAMTHLSVFTGKQLHGLAIKMGLQHDASIGNILITLYSKLDLISEPRQAFNDISEPDLISWNSMIQAHLDSEEFEEALNFYVEMKDLGFNPDKFSFVAAMVACASLPFRRAGRQVHCDLIKSGLALDSFTGSSLIDMYSKSMAAGDAKKVFDLINKKDLITWNSMIVGLAQNGYLGEDLSLLKQMKEEEIEPDNFTFASILSACANAIAIEQGKQVHAVILKSNLVVDTALINALITMYCRAGFVEEAENIFSSIKDKNVVSWTSMISGYAQCGFCKEALKLFDVMESSGEMPNAKTFIALLTACSYGGLTDEAMKYFEMMDIRFGIKPNFDHYACMVDILGRAGRLEEAEEFIEGMPYKPNALVWKMLLSSCRIHGDLGRGRRSMEKIMELEPGDSAAYVLLSNLYTALGFHEEAMKVRRMMRKNGVRKEPGKSWIEVNNRVHQFMAGEVSHPQTEEIYLRLKQLVRSMRDEGYARGHCILR